jgi:predicted nucleotidyltransferase
MRIARGQTIAGLPAVQVRNFLRWARVNEVSARQVSARLGASRAEAATILAELKKNGFVERKGRGWEVSDLGCRLCAAKAIKPLSRAQAEDLVAEVLRRVEIIREEEQFLYEVERLGVFGSYLSDVSDLGDVDLAVKMRRKPTVPWEQCEQFIEQAKAEGKIFRSIVEEVCWPELSANAFLRQGLRSCSFQPWSSVESLNTPLCILFQVGIGDDGA